MSHYAQALGAAMAPRAEVVVLDRGRDPSLWGMLMKLWKLSRKEGTYVVNTSPHWSVLFLVWVPGIKGGHVFHDPILNAATRWTHFLHVAYYRILTSRLGVVILHASRFEPHVKELRLPARTVAVVPHGFVPPQLVADHPYDPDGPLVLVGRLLPYKGFDVLAKAMELLRDRGVEAKVVVGGEGVTDDLARGDLPNIELRCGLLSDEEFTSLIAGCSGVLLPYVVATQSGVLATAFSAGRPVIASAIGSFPDYVDDGRNGILVPPGDAQALSAAIERFYSDVSLRRRLAQGAARSWGAELAPERCAERILSALKASVAEDET